VSDDTEAGMTTLDEIRARASAYSMQAQADLAFLLAAIECKDAHIEVWRERAERAERERDAAVANAYEVGKRDGASAQRKRDAGIADEERDCAATDLYDVRQQLGELYDPNCYGAGYDAGRKAAAEQIAAAIRQQDKGEPG
jgi:hypothetical protein